MSFSKALMICAAAALTGCASISYPLPKCDGAAKRPLNRSMWQWQEESAGFSGRKTDASADQAATPLSYASLTPTPGQTTASDHPAFATFDETGSRRACRAG